MSRTLGAILAGGRSRRFGSDKALARLDGKRLIDRVAAALRPQTDDLLVCGRVMPAITCVADRPSPDLGPLGGLNAALRYAVDHGFEAVITVPCDTPALPDDLAARLAIAGGAAIVLAVPVIGRWPASLADRLDRHLAQCGDHSVRRFAREIGATEIVIDGIANINTPDDLRRSERHFG